VSACLLGRACRYDGQSKGHDGVRAEVERLRAAGWRIHAACPEQHLGIPRPAVTLVAGDGHDLLAGRAAAIQVADGIDRTEAFREGAERSDHPDAVRAILKARSPSCGVGVTNIDGHAVPGDGVFAARLRQRGVELTTEAAFDREA
jgi:uncharacterized protein YbbK (DUF523 family)